MDLWKGKNVNQTVNNFQIDWKQVKNWLKDEEKIHSLQLSKKRHADEEKQSFQSWKRNVFRSFLTCKRKVTVSSIGALTPKQVYCWKKSILTKHPALRNHIDGLRVFVDVIQYLFEGKLMQLKCYQQFCIPLLRNSMQSLYKSAKEEFSQLSPSFNQRYVW